MVLQEKLHTCAELMEYINEVGFLPLLSLGIKGWSAEEVMDEDCQYVRLPEGGYEWPLWDWKGDIIRETGCAYGKFISKKAVFISKQWWPDFCNYRRSKYPYPEPGSIEEAILETLKLNDNMITRELRKACGFTLPKMRSKFDAYVARLQMGGYIVTEDFVYPRDKHGRKYGMGWVLLNTPENLFGREACHIDCSPEESKQRIVAQLCKILPGIDEKGCEKLLDKGITTKL